MHTQRLQAAQYITGSKSFEDRVRKTTYRITPTGGQALDDYLGSVEQLIATIREARRQTGTRIGGGR